MGKVSRDSGIEAAILDATRSIRGDPCFAQELILELLHAMRPALSYYNVLTSTCQLSTSHRYNREALATSLRIRCGMMPSSTHPRKRRQFDAAPNLTNGNKTDLRAGAQVAPPQSVALGNSFVNDSARLQGEKRRSLQRFRWASAAVSRWETDGGLVEGVLTLCFLRNPSVADRDGRLVRAL